MSNGPGAKWPDAVITAFLLLPGFIAIRVSEYYATGDKLSEVETIASALGFTLVILVCSLGLWRLWECWRRCAHAPIATVTQQTPFFALVILVSIGLGFTWAGVDSHDWAYKVSPTRRASRQPIWQWLFDTNAGRPEPRFVKVTLKDGTVYFGPPAKYSRSEDAEMVYLEPAAKMEGRGVATVEDGTSSVTRPPGNTAAATLPCTLVRGGVLVRKEAWDIVEFHLVTAAEKKEKDYCVLLEELRKSADQTRAPAVAKKGP